MTHTHVIFTLGNVHQIRKLIESDTLGKSPVVKHTHIIFALGNFHQIHVARQLSESYALDKSTGSPPESPAEGTPVGIGASSASM
jgi:hypothetical protein